MTRRKLVLLLGVLVVAIVAIRRRSRRDAVTIEIEDRESRDEATGEEETAVDLESIEGIGSAYAERLRAAGVTDAADLAAADPDDLASETGIGTRRIQGWIERVDDLDAGETGRD